LISRSNVKGSASALQTRLYREPLESRPYVIGADVAQGKEGGDFQAAQVLDCWTLEQVCVYQSKVEPHVFARHLRLLGHLYKTAEIAVESNTYGLSVILELRRAHYYRLYTRVDYDEIERKPKNEYGWLTTSASRPLLINEIRRVTSRKLIRWRDRSTVLECMQMRLDEKGRAEAPSGFHDDQAFALGIALMARKERWGELPLRPVEADTNPDLLRRMELWEKIRERTAEVQGEWRRSQNPVEVEAWSL